MHEELRSGNAGGSEVRIAGNAIRKAADLNPVSNVKKLEEAPFALL